MSGGAPLGNKNGAKSKRLFTDTLKRVLTQSPERIQKLAEQLVTWAEAGEQWAFREMLDRLEGKPHQSLDVYRGELPAEELPDGELLDIARRGRNGAAEAESGETQSPGLH
jgi:hypothetical protein